MTQKCLKCTYTRTEADTAPLSECPQCGAIYAKVEQAAAQGKLIVRARASPEVVRSDTLAPKPPAATNNRSSGYLNRRVSPLLLIVSMIAGIAAIWTVHSWREGKAAAASKQAAAESARAREEDAAAQRRKAIAAKLATPEYQASVEKIRARLEKETDATLKVRLSMKDPESFDLKGFFTGPSGSVCVTYRAKNSFGAIFPGRAIVGPNEGMMFEERDGAAFFRAWMAECGRP